MLIFGTKIKFIYIRRISAMKLYEEFKEYENLWDTKLEESFIKTFEGTDYDLTDETQLKELIDLVAKKKYKNLPLKSSRYTVTNNLLSQLRYEKVDRRVINIIEDFLISNKDFFLGK
jgi:hypothetical protein